MTVTIMIDMIDKTERLPTAKDGDAQGNVLALHKLQGYMTMHWSNVVKYGGYITHWGRLPEGMSCKAEARGTPVAVTILIDMVEKAERLPTAKDGDAQGTVLALHKLQGYMTMHWSNVVKFGSYITHWGRLPG